MTDQNKYSMKDEPSVLVRPGHARRGRDADLQQAGSREGMGEARRVVQDRVGLGCRFVA